MPGRLQRGGPLSRDGFHRPTLLKGVGWGSLPAWLVKGDLESGRLVRLPAKKLGAGGEVFYYAYFSHRSVQALGLAGRYLGECLEGAAANR